MSEVRLEQEPEYDPTYCKKCDDFFDASIRSCCPNCNKTKNPNEKTFKELMELFEPLYRQYLLTQIKNIKGE